ncbi:MULTISPECIES: type I restriction endonuclease subunit R [unclassified Empedobacter]|uniref:type I restriction endonuclease subunit R n=1 Tax=unclassified Empedobacter TaxID=2643773 RepID=UPI0025C0DDD4|nr:MULTISPECIES: HsdR family type I site-specific deoxyribonuclease [unclassified Empedobacter]
MGNNILKNVTEKELIQNWANILFENNKDIDRLNDVPLSDGEMQQILNKIQELRTPLNLNGFINGRSVTIKRDNPADQLHLGKEVSLKIYDRREIAAGQSRYQIVQQPRYNRKSEFRNDRRGDVLLLINGMPLIHIELKKTKEAVNEAVKQIEKYTYEGHFTGLFSLIQIFVAMTPDKTVYFANPGVDGVFNSDYQFEWADFNNEPIKEWTAIADQFLSIPMAHELIGYYTIADGTDDILKVMRSYQIYAASAISSRVALTNWAKPDIRGGYIWHTTGSGKTMTSFKSAQLIASSKNADKVIFLLDRIELGTQSLEQYRAFADESLSVQATEDTYVLINRLKSNDPADTLIVTSIQKMSNIESDTDGLKSSDLEIMRAKRIVVIIDEAHRTVFGETMLPTIRQTFPNAVFFGFTGTPIQEENKRNDSDTSTIFGNELHRYSLADGIRDKNVLGFDPYKVLTHKDRDLRRVVALQEANAIDEEDALSDPKKNEIYSKFMNPAKVKMAGDLNSAGKYQKGIEDYVKSVQYERPEHQKIVVKDIKENWVTFSSNSKFHAIFATSSIAEAIEYFNLFKQEFPTLKVSALFDPNIDNNAGFQFKEEGLESILKDYKERFGKHFTMSTHAAFKKDIANRLAHKKPYTRIHTTPEEQLDLLIVVDQMLTGFDSKWVNTLYLDKKLEYENIIQAFSRTNRLFGIEKPFGTIRYYRFPHTMERNINRAVKLYSGDRPYGLFVDHLDVNLERINFMFNEIKLLFENAGISEFKKLADDLSVRAKFAETFNILTKNLAAAKIQGFFWDKLKYVFNENNPKLKKVIEVALDETTYNILVTRYKELAQQGGDTSGGSTEHIPFEIDNYIMDIDTGVIDTNYMNSRFEKFLKSLNQKDLTPEQNQAILDELYKSFATLSQDEQKFANVFLNEVRSGNITLDPTKTFRDYISEYQFKAKNEYINKLVEAIGVDPEKLKQLMNTHISETNLNDFGRFGALKDSVDRAKAKTYFEAKEGTSLPPFKVSIRIDNLLKEFILKDGFEI